MAEWKDKLCVAMRAVLVAASLFGVCGQAVEAATVSGAQQAQAAPSMQGVSAHKSSLLGVTSYTIYYGAPTPEAIARLRAYPLVIIEPRNWTAPQMLQLKAGGCEVLGYLSVLEQNRNADLLKRAWPSDYLWIDGHRDARANGESWSMNISSRHYRDLLLADYQQQIVNKRLDGVFLDTMGDADDGIWSDAVSGWQRNGAVQFVAGLRATYRDLSIVQNWGIGTLKDRTAPYLDGILWENFDPQTVGSNSWCKSRMEELDHLHQTKGLSVFTEVNGIGHAWMGPFDRINEKHGYVGHLFADGYDCI